MNPESFFFFAIANWEYNWQTFNKFRNQRIKSINSRSRTTLALLGVYSRVYEASYGMGGMFNRLGYMRSARAPSTTVPPVQMLLAKDQFYIKTNHSVAFASLGRGLKEASLSSTAELRTHCPFQGYSFSKPVRCCSGLNPPAPSISKPQWASAAGWDVVSQSGRSNRRHLVGQLSYNRKALNKLSGSIGRLSADQTKAESRDHDLTSLRGRQRRQRVSRETALDRLRRWARKRPRLCRLKPARYGRWFACLLIAFSCFDRNSQLEYTERNRPKPRQQAEASEWAE